MCPKEGVVKLSGVVHTTKITDQKQGSGQIWRATVRIAEQEYTPECALANTGCLVRPNDSSQDKGTVDLVGRLEAIGVFRRGARSGCGQVTYQRAV